jgi:hypothetical protein
MPLANYLVRNASGPIRRGDVVFEITELKEGQRQRVDPAHVGIVVEDRESFKREDPIRVIHMTLRRVSEHEWNTAHPKASHVDLVGSITTLEKGPRAKIIDEAVTLQLSKPSIIQKGLGTNACECIAYWAGDPNPSAHPNYPNRGGLYAFTCATFVMECFKKAKVVLLVTDNMPFASASDRQEFRALLEPHGLANHIQETPFKRIYPSYLAHAFHRDQYPLDVSNWKGLQDHGHFIPPPEDTQSPRESTSPVLALAHKSPQ